MAKIKKAQKYRLFAEPRGYSNGRSLEIFRKTIPIAAGTGDDVSVYYDAQYIYVYSENSGLEYVGLEVFERETGEPVNDVFMNGGDSTDDVLWCLSLSYKSRAITFLDQWIWC